jgi:membrane peptidoglycan carboxypeptidase
VSKSGVQIHREAAQTQSIGLGEGQLNDLTWTLSQNPAGRLADGRPTAAVTGTWQMRNLPSANSDAWIAGFTPQYGVAVWIGNRANEQPLKDRAGAPVTGATLPAQIYRAVLGEMLAGAPRWLVPAPAYTGNPNAGNAGS